MRLFLDEPELRRLGMSEANITTFRALAAFVTQQAGLDTVTTDVSGLDTRLTTAESEINALQSTVADTTAEDAQNTRLNSAESRLGAYDALAPFVRQDQAAAPAYTPYAGQTASVGYVQAEAQATDDAVLALGAAFDDLVTALQTANVLT